MTRKLPVLVFAFLMMFTIAQAQITATVSSTNPTCAGNNGTATITPSGGGGYTYKWSNGQTTQTATALGAGTYTVTAYSSSGATNWDTIYRQTFDSTVQTWSTNISTGTNDPYNNYWDISDSCVGNGAIGSCVNNTYSPASGSNKSLYITAQDNGFGIGQFAGARYDAGGLCAALSVCVQTDLAAQSPNINTAGAHNLVLGFQYTAGGDGLNDNASLYYSINGGTTFTQLDPSLKSVNNSNCMADGDDEGTWAYKTYNLPSSCNNINNLVIRFRWVNNDDAAGTDPSVAIDNVSIRDSVAVAGADSVVKTVTLTTPTGPVIVTTSLVITNAACGQSNGSISGIGIASGTGTSPYTVDWKNSSNVIVSNSYALTNVPAGSYTFEVTDAAGCGADTTLAISPGSGAPPLATTSKDTICTSDSAQICVPNTFAHYHWNVGDTTACFYTSGAGNYYVTVTDNNGCTTTSNHVAVAVLPQPPVSITQNGDTLSVNNGVTFQWYLGNNLIPNATSHTYIATQSGIYYVVVTDGNGCTILSSGIGLSVGIVQLSADFGFEIYPNPVSSGTLQVLAGLQTTGQQLQIFDAEGRLVYDAKIKNQKTEVPVYNFESGMYIVKVGTAVKKFIKE